MAAEMPLVSIVGRPNVGKSTLFNRLMGRRVSIVDDTPGVTRDRIYGRTFIEGIPCHLVDTGGLSYDTGGGDIETGVEKQIMMSIESSTALVFVVEVQTGVTPEDRFVADVLRKSGKPVILAANKADSTKHDNEALEFHELGFGEPVPCSALHGRGVGEITGLLGELLPGSREATQERPAVRFCVAGRPNVGKSSITNAILGEDRCIVSGTPGTTRDRVDTEFQLGGTHFVIVDTAGIKRRKTKMDSLEFYGFTRAKRAIGDSDVTVLVLDAREGALEGDKRIAGYVIENKKGLIVAVNKMDLIEDPDYDVFLENTFRTAPFLKNTPFLFISALERSGMDVLLENVLDVHRRLNELLPLELLKNVIFDTRMLYSPPSRGKRAGEIRGVIHDRSNPPRIIIKVNDTELFPTDYRRLIENRIRAVFNLAGVPLDMVFSSTGKKAGGKK